MSDNDYLAFSNDSPSPNPHHRRGQNHSALPYARPQQRWQHNPQHKFAPRVQYPNHPQNNSGSNRFQLYPNHQPQHRCGFTNDANAQHCQNYPNPRHSAGGGHFNRIQHNGRQRSGFGFQQNQKRNFQIHSHGNHLQKESTIDNYYHPSMVEDPWSWFDRAAASSSSGSAGTDRRRKRSRSDDLSDSVDDQPPSTSDSAHFEPMNTSINPDEIELEEDE